MCEYFNLESFVTDYESPFSYLYNLFFSFQICYEQEFQESLPVDDLGVPLEHLISCVPNLEIKFVGPNKNIKVIIFSETQNSGENEEGRQYFKFFYKIVIRKSVER